MTGNEDYEMNPSNYLTISIKQYEKMLDKIVKYEKKLGLLEGQLCDANSLITNVTSWNKKDIPMVAHYLETWGVK